MVMEKQEQGEVKHQTVEEDVALLREHGVRVWNWRTEYGLKVIWLSGGEEEGLRAADIALSLGLPVLRVNKQWPCTLRDRKRWERPNMILELHDFGSDASFYGFDFPDGSDVSDA